MTAQEMIQLLQQGHQHFVHAKNGREYTIHPDQWEVLEYPGAALICYPVVRNPRKRGREWTFICPKNLKLKENTNV